MAQLRLALLNAAQSDDGIAGTSRNFRRELSADLTEYVVCRDQLPPPDEIDLSTEYDGVVVSGSAASAYWDDPWIESACEWVRSADDQDLPILGVCFGHQLLAQAFGGTVEPMGEFEIGYRQITLTDGDCPVLDGIEERFTVFISHGDTVSELPEGATLTASNEYGVHGFQRNHAFGVQFHPEYDMETAERVTRGKEFLGEERIESVVSGITQENYEAAYEVKRLFDNFTDYVRSVRSIPI